MRTAFFEVRASCACRDVFQMVRAFPHRSFGASIIRQVEHKILCFLVNENPQVVLPLSFPQPFEIAKSHLATHGVHYLERPKPGFSTMAKPQVDFFGAGAHRDWVLTSAKRRRRGPRRRNTAILASHGSLPTYLARVRPRLRRAFARPYFGVVSLRSVVQERLLLRQPEKPLLARHGARARQARTAERGRRSRLAGGGRSGFSGRNGRKRAFGPRGIDCGEKAAAARRARGALGCHRGVRHQGVVGREHQERRSRARRAHRGNHAHRGRRLQREHCRQALQALPAVEGGA